MSVARGLNCHAYACISFTDATKLNRPPISNHMPSRHHHPVISIWSQISKSDVGEQWHTISNSNSVIPFQQHTIPICMCSNATCAIGGIISFPIGHHKRTYKSRNGRRGRWKEEKREHDILVRTADIRVCITDTQAECILSLP